VYLYGADLRQPILNSRAISLAAFTDVAVLGNQGSVGGMVGIGGRLAGVITYGAQIRMLGENFVPVYFDSTYDLFRADKYAVASATSAVVDPYTGWLASLGFSLFGDLLVFNASLDGRSPVGDRQLPGLAALLRPVHRGRGWCPTCPGASYDKRNLAADGASSRDLFSFADSVIRAA
jgi:hypothetical protein